MLHGIQQFFFWGSIDFWTDQHYIEAFTAFVINLVVEKYELLNGISLLMSRYTKTMLTSKLRLSFFLTGTPILANDELIMNFECLLKAV